MIPICLFCSRIQEIKLPLMSNAYCATKCYQTVLCYLPNIAYTVMLTILNIRTKTLVCIYDVLYLYIIHYILYHLIHTIYYVLYNMYYTLHIHNILDFISYILCLIYYILYNTYYISYKRQCIYIIHNIL